jgi:O-antigen/teichoic acid export membrane protein
VRWQERQAAQRRKNHQRQSWILFVITGGIAAGLFVALGISILSVLKEPDQLLIFSVYRLVSFLIQVEAAGGFLTQMMKSLASAIPLAVWIGLIGLASMVSVLWFVLFKRLITERRVVQ